VAEVLVAVALDDEGNIAAHAGRAADWQIFALDQASGTADPVWKLALSKTGSLHEWHVRGDGNRHPLHYVDVAIAGSAGDGVIRNLGLRNTELLTTTETDPLRAIQAYVRGDLAAGLPHDERACHKQ